MTKDVPILTFEFFDKYNGNNCWIKGIRLIGEKENHDALVKRFKKCDALGRKTKNVKIEIVKQPI